TQYLEEADALADRVGIISEGRLQVEGPPAELKRSISEDVIVAELDGDTVSAIDAVKQIPRVSGIDVRDDVLSMHTLDGAAVLADVAVALKGADVALRSLTLR